MERLRDKAISFFREIEPVVAFIGVIASVIIALIANKIQNEVSQQTLQAAQVSRSISLAEQFHNDDALAKLLPKASKLEKDASFLRDGAQDIDNFYLQEVSLENSSLIRKINQIPESHVRFEQHLAHLIGSHNDHEHFVQATYSYLSYMKQMQVCLEHSHVGGLENASQKKYSSRRARKRSGIADGKIAAENTHSLCHPSTLLLMAGDRAQTLAFQLRPILHCHFKSQAEDFLKPTEVIVGEYAKIIAKHKKQQSKGQAAVEKTGRSEKNADADGTETKATPGTIGYITNKRREDVCDVYKAALDTLPRKKSEDPNSSQAALIASFTDAMINHLENGK